MIADIGLAKASNDLISAGIVAYALALLAYAGDCAYGNHAERKSRPAERTPEPRRAPALVASGAQGADASVLESDGAHPNTPNDGLVGNSDAGSAWPRRRIGAVAVGLTMVGWLLHGGAILTRGLSVHRLPWGNMYEFDVALTFAAVTAFLVMLTRHRVRFLGVFIMTPVVLALGLAATVLYVPAGPLVPALHSYWLAIHVTAAIVASGVFTVGTAATAMYLLAERYAAATTAGRAVRFSALARMFPDTEVLDQAAYRAYLFAFPLWTFAVVAGAIWAEASWGHYWQWDPKETWSFITWVIYAGYLHARATAGWRRHAAAYIALIGYVAFLFNFFGVNTVLVGLHSYAGV